MFKYALLAAAGACLVGCNASQTAVTAAICTDVATLQSSTLKLNTNETTALNAVMSTCASTAGGTTFNNATVALALINDAILLQSSGLFSNVHITAQAPEQRQALIEMRQKWESYAHANGFR